MKAKHTPGPWQSKMNIASAAIYCPLGGLIARLPVEHEGSRNGAAHNARLIAAAPELMEALKACAAVCAGETTNKRGLISALEQARAALAKCEGVK